MRIAKNIRVRRPSLLAAFALVTLSSGLALADGGEGWMASSASFSPIEQRVAVASGPTRTTTWMSLRFDGPAGPVGLVLPAPSGAAIDLASDAWFEALEVATAPRIFPPSGQAAVCPGVSPPKAPFAVAGDLGHTASLAGASLVLPDAPSVVSWANDNGLVVSPELAQILGAVPPSMRFVVLRVDAPGGPALSPTVRIVTPGTMPVLPLALTRAGNQDLRVTSFLLGAGRGDLVGATELTVPSDKIVWNAKTGATSYESARADLLATTGPLGVVLESAGHSSFAEDQPIANGTATIGSVISTYFERASAYGDTSSDVSLCIVQAATAFASGAAIATACPRGDLGVIDGSPACTDGTDGVSPDVLRCGPAVDDLAVALSSLPPSQAWLTRRSLAVPSSDTGLGFTVSFSQKPAVSSVLKASTIDTGGCSSTSSSSSSSSSSGSSGGVSSGPTGSTSSGSTSGEPDDLSGSDDGTSVVVNLDTSGCSCDGTQGTSDGSGTSGDSCSGGTSGGDSSDSCGGDSSGGGDSCGGDSSGGDSCSGGSSGGDSCSGGSSGGDSCSGGGSSSGCSGGGGNDCSVGGSKRRSPRASILMFLALAVLAPLRRRGRKTRSERAPTAKMKRSR